MRERIYLNFKEKRVGIDLKVCSFIEKFFGLMFCRREKAEALLFKFKNPIKIKIHSWFVFFPFVVVWLDEKNKVIDFKVVRNFKFGISPKKSFCRLVEIPINKKYEQIVKKLCSRPHLV